jgi:hypothetical protein
MGGRETMSKIPQEWWEGLLDHEQNLLIEYLYDLDLTEHFVMDKEGNIVERLRQPS